MKTFTGTKKLLFLAVCSLALSTAFSQRIVYSEPERDDTRRISFEVIGKINGKYLVYKNIRNRNWITVFDDNMNVVRRVEQDYMPDDRLINVDFFPYSDFFYMIYQYQKRNVVYCVGVKVDGDGRKISDLMELDTSHISALTSNKIYSVISSEDKSRLMLFKINSKNKQRYLLTTKLFDDKSQLLKKSVIPIEMEDRNEYLDEFYLDNQGDFVFTKFYRQNNDNINRGSMVVKEAESDSLFRWPLDIEKRYLDELHVKIDNFNHRYLLTSFYYNERRGNIEGFYFFVWDKASGKPQMENTVAFGDELRKEARGDASSRGAFNDYFIRHIVIRKDGGFIIGSEAFYTTSRYNAWNRWDYLYGSPFYGPLDYYYYSPYYNSLWYRSRFYNNNQNVRYHADNIVILSFDNTGKLQWNNVISKGQYDDDTDDLISYQLMNTGGQLHFLFNIEERRTNLLNDYVMTGGGQVNHNPTLKNLDKGYEFMAKYGKQVSAYQIIIPCLYRKNICFENIDFN